MIEVLAVDQDINISGYVSPVSLTRSNRRELVFFVNSRPVQDLSLSSALTQAYHTMLMVGRYPMAALLLDLPPELVDVNVHPTKAEVRFRDPGAVFTAVQRAVRKALLAHSPVPGLAPPSTYWQTPVSTARGDLPVSQWELSGGQTRVDAPFQPAARPDGGAAQADFHRSLAPAPILRLVGQVGAAYLVAEGPDGLYLIDQHAAHERVLYEKMIAQLGDSGSGKIPAQALLEPVPVDLPASSARLIAQHLPVLARLGFQVEEFGKNSFLIRSMPALLSGMDPFSALNMLIEDFEEDEAPLQSELEKRIVARICKRAAIKSGKLLSGEEQRTLLTDLEACRSPRTCPHGRPTMIHLSVDLLERQFGRRGAR
jgi:DNA mismatch repair protein MutL